MNSFDKSRFSPSHRPLPQAQPQPRPPFSVLIADDKAEVRSALRLLLDQEDDMEVVGEARDGKEMLAQAELLEPSLLLLDWELNRGLSSEIPGLQGGRTNLAIVALSGRPESRKDALRAGVDAFVSKAEPPERLLAAIRQAHAKAHATAHAEAHATAHATAHAKASSGRMDGSDSQQASIDQGERTT